MPSDDTYFSARAVLGAVFFAAGMMVYPALSFGQSPLDVHDAHLAHHDANLASAVADLQTSLDTLEGNLVALIGELRPTWSRELASDDGDSDGCDSSRFRCIFADAFGPQAVLDLETGLVWQLRTASLEGDWVHAKTFCLQQMIASRRGWRLPDMAELSTLIRRPPFDGSDRLPNGHPFDLQDSNFWTSTPVPGQVDKIYVVGLVPPVSLMIASSPTATRGVWCVRGGEDSLTRHID